MSISLTNDEPFQLVDMSATGKFIFDVKDDYMVAKCDGHVEKLEHRPDIIDDTESRDSYDQSVHTDVRYIHRDNEVSGYLGDIDSVADNSVTRYARLILLTSKYTAPAIKYAEARHSPPENFLTQLIIDSHVAVVNKIINIGRIEPTPRNIITYIYGSFEQVGVSPLAGPHWATLKYSDQVMSVLAVARVVVSPLWFDYDDMIYTECHRQLDNQALFYVQSVYYQRRAHRHVPKCCTVM